MVLPLLVASGVTATAVFLKSGLKAWARYGRLHKVDIANLNDIEFISQANTVKSPMSREDPETLKHIKILQFLHDYQGGFYKAVNREESLLIFNFQDMKHSEINSSLIKSRHRQLMFLNHPDRNGSPLLASKINEAKDILMQNYSN